MKTHPAADAVRITEAFVALASGEHERGKRDPGLGVTRHDRRLLRQFAEDGRELPTGALVMEKHLGYRFCNIPGTEVNEVLSLYNEIRGHGGTWGFHEDQLKDRGAGLVLEARRLVDDLGEASDALSSGDFEKRRVRALIEGVRDRMARERDAAHKAASGLREFATAIHENLAPKTISKLHIVAETRHNSEAFGLRAKLKRLLAEIADEERAYARVLDGDEFNVLGRRVERTLYGAAAVEAHEKLFDLIYEYKKVIGQVAIQHRLLKSLGLRRVHMANAALAARSGSQGLDHLATVLATTVAALDAILETFDAAKKKALKGLVKELEELITVWGTVEGLAAVNADTLG